MPIGLYRDPADKWVRVRYEDGAELDVPEERYREMAYQPDYESLPLKSDERTANGGE